MILALTLLLVLAVIALTATATICLSVLFIAVMLAVSFAMTRSHHRTLLERAQRVTPVSAPGLSALVAETVARLQPGPIEVFVAPARTLNAYTFGLSSPKVVVLHSTLLQALDADELRFVIGHEIGHVRLGHTWLNSLVGGMAGIPSPFLASALLSLAFLWWNRACEYSADRAGTLACGDPHKAISALIKLAGGASARTGHDVERTLRRIESENDTLLGSLGEMLKTHPMMVRRIEQIQRYAASAEYRRLQPLLDRNVYPAPGRTS